MIGRLRPFLAIGVVALVLAGEGVAWASFNSGSTASSTYSTSVLAAATGLSAANTNCVSGISTQVNLTWTPTSSSYADGYEIDRSAVSGGPYTRIGTVSGQSSTTYTDTAVIFSTTYYYTVKATKSAWRSANSNEAAITTLSLFCT